MKILRNSYVSVIEIDTSKKSFVGCSSRGVMAKVLDCDNVVSVFEL